MKEIFTLAKNYKAKFIPKKLADDLFTLAKSLPHFQTANVQQGKIQGYLKRLTLPSWSAFGTFRGIEENAKNQGSYRQEYKDAKDLLMYKMDEAPRAVRDLAIALSKFAKKPVNYFALVGYADETHHIDWHQHGEDRGRDARVFIVSLGAVRTFRLRPICPKCRVCDECNQSACDGHTRTCKKCKGAKAHKNGDAEKGIKPCPITNDKSKEIRLHPVHGSVILIPDEYNFTHEHAVLDHSVPRDLRISFNTKCLPTDETLKQFIKRMRKPPSTTPAPNTPEEQLSKRKNMAENLARETIRPVNAAAKKLTKKLLDEFPVCPRVWSRAKSQGPYPSGAVYVGCKTRDRRTGNVLCKGTPYGNGKNPRRSHRPWIADNEKDFRAYAEKKMLDPAFAAKAIKDLRGKHLICWCVQDGPKRDPFCHARVWFDLVNTHKDRRYIPYVLDKKAADDLYKRIVDSPDWQVHKNDNTNAQKPDAFFIAYGKSYDKKTSGKSDEGGVEGEIPTIPPYLRNLADKAEKEVNCPVNYIQCHKYGPTVSVRPHYDPSGTYVPMLTIGQQRTFRVDGVGVDTKKEQRDREVSQHKPREERLMRNGDLLIFNGGLTAHSMYPAKDDPQFNSNGYDWRISILFRWTTDIMRKFGPGKAANQAGQRQQYKDDVKKWRIKQCKSVKHGGK
jgi:hypothetical protein